MTTSNRKVPTAAAPSRSDLCSLPDDERQDRVEMIRRELLPYVKRSEKLPNGLAWEFDRDPDIHAKLEHFVAFERECCSGLDFTLQELPGVNTLRLLVEGKDAGAFEDLGGRMETGASAGGPAARLLKAGGFGFGAAFFVCCVLPMGIAALGGAALAAPLARLDAPSFVAAGSLAMAIPAWLFMGRRRSRGGASQCDHGC